ncbi:hypothetical protein L9F63_002198, partial [Diploptera punctata]
LFRYIRYNPKVYHDVKHNCENNRLISQILLLCTAISIYHENCSFEINTMRCYLFKKN